MRVAVIGAGGMLGRAVVKAALEFEGLTHSECDILNADSIMRALAYPDGRAKYDTVVNCAGVCNSGSLVNSLGPWKLARVAQRLGIRVLHVSTDCVFDDKLPEGWAYKAGAHIPNPVSPYGVAKALGEQIAWNVVNVRTSFVGYEHGLLRWFLDLPVGAEVYGYTKAYWSGSTVNVVAAELVRLAGRVDRLPYTVHLATRDPITKYEALCIMREQFGRSDITIVEDASVSINRALVANVALPPFKDALKQYAPEAVDVELAIADALTNVELEKTSV